MTFNSNEMLSNLLKENIVNTKTMEAEDRSRRQFSKQTTPWNE
jgi:hypothetical protein